MHCITYSRNEIAHAYTYVAFSDLVNLLKLLSIDIFNSHENAVP